MKIAFVGKGGAGKTSLSALFIRHLSTQHLPVVAIDADINQHLAVALGMDEGTAGSLPPLGQHIHMLKDYLRGNNPRITSADVMVKTTPAGRGSRLLKFGGDDPFHATFAQAFGDVFIMATGPFPEEDLGVACYHSKVGAVELYLNHLVDRTDEYVVVDMTAGADSFASGLFTRFDTTFLVVEPTHKGVSVYRQYRDYAADYDIKLRVVGNKIQSQDDIDFLREQIGEPLLATVSESRFIRLQDQGKKPGFETLEPNVVDVLHQLKAEVDRTPKNWRVFQAQAIEFHLRNAAAWANTATGIDLASQVDRMFVMGPTALAG